MFEGFDSPDVLAVDIFNVTEKDQIQAVEKLHKKFSCICKDKELGHLDMHINDNDTEDSRKVAPEESIDNELGKEESQREYKCKRFKAMELKKLGNFGRGDKVDDVGPVTDCTTCNHNRKSVSAKLFGLKSARRKSRKDEKDEKEGMVKVKE